MKESRRSLIEDIAFRTRKALYMCSYILDTKVLKRKNLISIFCYHSIADNDWRFSVSPHVFKQQILSLMHDGYTFVTLTDVYKHITGEKKLVKPSVCICFDDGYADLVEIAPFLTKHGIYPSLFVLSDPSDANRIELDNTQKLLTTDQIKELNKLGWEIGSHTATHPDLLKMNATDLEKEIVLSKKRLESDLVCDVQFIAYPKGRYNQKVLDLAIKAGYIMGLTMDDALISENTDLLTIPRIGIDRTHSLAEFKGAGTLLAITIRKYIKRSFSFMYS